MRELSNRVDDQTMPAPEGKEIRAYKQARRRRSINVNILRVLILVVFVGGWQLFTSVPAKHPIIDPFFWGQPSGVWNQLVTWVTQGTAQGSLWEQVGVTLEEALLGFLVGSVLGIIVGILLGSVRFLSDILGPYVKALNSIPRIALAPLLAVGLGLGIQSKVALSAILVFFIVFFNAFQGVREVDRNLLANARILGASPARVTTSVILPSALTWIFASLHVSFSFALVGAVVGEYVGAIQGLGLLIQTAGQTFNNNGVIAAMVILAAIALISESLITALERRLLRWRPTTVVEATI